MVCKYQKLPKLFLLRFLLLTKVTLLPPFASYIKMLTLSSTTQIPLCNGLLHPSDNSDVYTFSSTVKPGYLEIALHNYRLLYYFQYGI